MSTNPKEAAGAVKVPVELWPEEATAVGCLGMLEGVLKYGKNNYLAGDGVVCTTYIAAAKRHLDDYLAGNDDAFDTGSDNLGNALASIAIIVKARAHGTLIDDRNYSPNGNAYQRLIEKLTPQVAKLKAMFGDRKPKHWTIQDNKQ